jgi:nitroreductase
MPLTTEQLLGALRWRYATKQFDPARKIPQDIWSALEETLVLTPSSFGLQPWKFLVVQDPALRAQLVPHSWNQRQVADASHLVIMTVMTRMTVEHIDKYLQDTARTRQVPVESMAGYRKMMIGDVVEGARGKISTEWATRQAYIALGNLMTSAALLGLDTCPMEGFEQAKYDEILGLAPRGLTTAVLCPVGYRAGNDKYASLAKVRFPKTELIEYR